MQWIYISPHFDDAVFSCAGLIWQQVRSGDRVEIWTICAGEIPSGELSPYAQQHHLRWKLVGATVVGRAQEDRRACNLLGAGRREFPIPDCIYRRGGDNYLPEWRLDQPPDLSNGNALYCSHKQIFGEIHPAEAGLVCQLGAELQRVLPPGAQCVSPLALGGHVDHRLSRIAVEAAANLLWYYADFPYAAEHPSDFTDLGGSAWESQTHPIPPLAAEKWAAAMAAYSSQISTFWHNLPEMKASLERYLAQRGGLNLWRAAAN